MSSRNVVSVLVVSAVLAVSPSTTARGEEAAPCGLFNNYEEETEWGTNKIWHAVNTHSSWEFLSNWFGTFGHPNWVLAYAQQMHTHGDAESCGN